MTTGARQHQIRASAACVPVSRDFYTKCFSMS
jgi:hypothetical protein